MLEVIKNWTPDYNKVICAFLKATVKIRRQNE